MFEEMRNAGFHQWENLGFSSPIVAATLGRPLTLGLCHVKRGVVPLSLFLSLMSSSMIEPCPLYADQEMGILAKPSDCTHASKYPNISYTAFNLPKCR